jgi:tetratricopeptide (TPR) repeat protein
MGNPKMSSKTPIVHQISWKLTIPQFAMLAVFIIVFAALFWSSLGYFSVSIGALAYLVYKYGLQGILLRTQRQGIRLIKEKQYKEAIGCFERSYEFFSKHSWLDHYRFVTLLTPSPIPLREMALLNIAFCYSQLGDKENTKAYYERTLREFPDSAMAETALNLITTVEGKPAS